MRLFIINGESKHMGKALLYHIVKHGVYCASYVFNVKGHSKVNYTNLTLNPSF